MSSTLEHPVTATVADVTPRPVVVVGIDGSADSELALRFAATEAVLRGAALRIVCAYEMPQLAYSAGFDLPIDVVRMMAAAAKEEAAAAVQVARSAVNGAALEITALALPGRPSRVLIEHSTDAALLVVGTRRLGGAGRLFLGSVSTELIHHSMVPVVVVPGRTADAEPSGSARPAWAAGTNPSPAR